MIINQPVSNHDDLLKVVDNMLGEAGLNRADLKGELTFAGLDPLRPSVLKVGAAGAAVVAGKAIASALIYQEKTVIGSQAEMSLTPETWDPITTLPGSSYPEWLAR
jgi:hypothetical protein